MKRLFSLLLISIISLTSSAQLKVSKDNLSPKDTTKKKPLKKSSTMSSSKSGIIYEPEPQQDTTKKPK